MAFTKIGSLWLKRDKKNRQYLAGYLNTNGGKIHVSIYMNEKKEKEGQPDYLVYEQTIDRNYRKV
jgi:uncharacterized protein (DUF736 family)